MFNENFHAKAQSLREAAKKSFAPSSKLCALLRNDLSVTAVTIHLASCLSGIF